MAERADDLQVPHCPCEDNECSCVTLVCVREINNADSIVSSRIPYGSMDFACFWAKFGGMSNQYCVCLVRTSTENCKKQLDVGKLLSHCFITL